jgi:glycosyltransferase involved in cell wall biosynthesis
VKIAHFAARLREPGGTAEYILRVTGAQRAAGHEVHLFHTGANDSEALHVRDERELYERARSCEVLHLHNPVSLAPPPDLPTVRTLHGHDPYCPSGTQHLRTRGQPCDRVAGPLCVWGHVADRCGSVRPAALLTGMRRIHDERATLPSMQVVAISDFVRARMIRAGFDAQRVHVVHHPAPQATSRGHDKGARFLYAGRLVPEKGIDWLLDAIARVPDIDIDVAGAGPAEANLHRLATRLGVRNRVAFHGWLDQVRLGTLLASTRALVFPSLWQEPAGLVALDAAAYGRAVIASRVGGIPEYAIDGKNALLVEPNDVVGLAGALARLAADPDLAGGLGRAGLEMTRGPFSLATHLDGLERIYQRART